MTPSERAALVAQIAAALNADGTYRPGDFVDGIATAARRARLCREAAEWLAAAERVCAERAPARPDMAEAVTDGDDLAA